MTFFTDKGRFRKAWDSFRQTFRRVSPQQENQQHSDIENGTVQRLLRRKPILLAGSALVVLAVAGFSSSHYVKAHTVDFVEVYQNGSLIGEVGSKQQVTDFISQTQKKLDADNAGVHMVLDTGKITYGVKSAYKAQPDSAVTLQKLGGLFDSHATGVELVVDGKRVGIVKDKATADALLARVQGKYAPKTKSEKTEVTALAYSPDGSRNRRRRSNR